MSIHRVMVAAAVVGFGLAAAGPVLASPASGDAFARWSARGGMDAPTRAPNFAGYTSSSPQSSATMTATIVLPKLKCGKTNASIEPGAGAYYLPGSITDLSTAGMFVGCHSGKARYYPAFTLNGVNKSYPKLRAKAGDTVAVTASISPLGTTLSVVDESTKTVKKKLRGTGASVQSVLAGDSEYPATKFSAGPVPDFREITFSQVLWDGLPLGGVLGNVQFDRYRGSVLQIATAPFIGDSVFKTAFKHS